MISKPLKIILIIVKIINLPLSALIDSKLPAFFLFTDEQCKFVKQIYFPDETLSMRSDKTN
jgi:hypothetical protein